MDSGASDAEGLHEVGLEAHVDGTVDAEVDQRPGPTFDRLWTDRSPRLFPADEWPFERDEATVAFDEARERLVIMAPNSAPAKYSFLWEFDPVAGKLERHIPSGAPDTWPLEFQGASLFYDPARRKVSLYGGANPSMQLESRGIWEWDGASATWTNRTPASLPTAWPSASVRAKMATDPTRSSVWLYGGARDALTSERLVSELWRWQGDSGAWTNETPAAGSMPPEMSVSSISIDRRNGDLYLIQGRMNGATLWQRRSTGFYVVSDADTPAGPAPDWLNQPYMAWDDARSLFVAPSSIPTTGGVSPTFEFDPDRASWADRTVVETRTPWPRGFPRGAVYDPRRGTVLMVVAFDGWEYEIWEWDGSKVRGR